MVTLNPRGEAKVQVSVFFPSWHVSDTLKLNLSFSPQTCCCAQDPGRGESGLRCKCTHKNAPEQMLALREIKDVFVLISSLTQFKKQTLCCIFSFAFHFSFLIHSCFLSVNYQRVAMSGVNEGQKNVEFNHFKYSGKKSQQNVRFKKQSVISFSHLFCIFYCIYCCI